MPPPRSVSDPPRQYLRHLKSTMAGSGQSVRSLYPAGPPAPTRAVCRGRENRPRSRRCRGLFVLVGIESLTPQGKSALHRRGTLADDMAVLHRLAGFSIDRDKQLLIPFVK